MGSGGIAQNMYPAKFTFDINATPSCTNDFLVVGLNVASSATQANLVGLNQLYRGTSGLCSTGTAATMWAYRGSTSGGKVLTSPIISFDATGSKVAFVESATSSSIFHVLTWTSGQGTIGSPVTPGSMTSLTFNSTATDTNSSPFIDYNTNTVYVGDDSGKLHKIINVFTGTPTEVTTGGWPVTVSSGVVLTGPVFDSVTHNIYVGDASGNLKSINADTAALSGTVLQVGGSTSNGASAAVVDPPLVDSTNGKVYEFAACNATDSSAVVVQATTGLVSQARADIGAGHGSNAGCLSGVKLHAGAFDDAYFTSGINNGSLFACGMTINGGNGNTKVPILYQFPFALGVMQTTATDTNNVGVGLSGSECSPVTELKNGSTDRVFVGDTTGGSGEVSAYVVTSGGIGTATTVSGSEAGGTSGIVIDNVSASAQASSLYFGSLTGHNVVKLTQSGLN